jgi:hypothetical protein
MAQTAIVGQAPINLGPLTTVFVRPAACTVGLAQTDGGLLGLGLLGGGIGSVAELGQTCAGGSPADNTACWPPVTAGVRAPAPLQGWGYYSPGISCPAGHVSACSATAGGNQGWPVQFKLSGGETAVGCCPR